MTAQKNEQTNVNTDELEVLANNKDAMTNAPEVSEYGHEAAKAWNTADKENNRGDQLAILALFHAWSKVTLSANVHNRKGEFQERISFVIADLLETPTNPDGTRNNAVITTRTNTIADVIFGVAAAYVDQAFKNRITRALEVVEYFVRMGYTEEQVTLVEKQLKIKGKSQKVKVLRVPFTALNDSPEPDADGKIDEDKLAAYNANKSLSVVLDGTKQENGKTRTVAELVRRAKPPAEKRGAKEQTEDEKSQAFGSSLKFMVATLHTFTDKKALENGTEIAFNKPTRKQLWELHQLLNQYFEEVEPLDREEEKEYMGEKKDEKAA